MVTCPYCHCNPFGVTGSSAVDCCEYGYMLFGWELSRAFVDNAAQHRMHLTDGILRDLSKLSEPEQLSALKDLLTPPIGR